MCFDEVQIIIAYFESKWEKVFLRNALVEYKGFFANFNLVFF